MSGRTLAAALAGCGIAAATAAAASAIPGQQPDQGLPQGSEAVTLNPTDFSTTIDNPYWPMTPGSRWVYRETRPDGSRQRVVITVTHRTRKVANGITARIVRDVASEHGRTVEATDDLYAQDKAGNVWYLGEDTAEYRNGKVVSRHGSFEAGVDGAQPGIQMPADPQPGLSYRQEYRKGEAEDNATVVTIGQELVDVPFRFATRDVLMIRERNPLEPRLQELKFYARGVGLLLAMHTDREASREELVSFRPGR